AVLARLPARSSEPVAARHAEWIELACARVPDRAAAIVPCGRDAAHVVLVMADVALGVATHGIAADTDRLARIDVADDIARTWKTRSWGSAAIAGLLA